MYKESVYNLIQRNGRVKRFHTSTTLGSETIAEHSWGVAMLCIALTDNRCSVRLLSKALFHDLPEQETGDLPAPVKWEHPILRTALGAIEDVFELKHETYTVLNEEEQFIFKVADMLHLLTTVHHEYMLGNMTMNELWENGNDYLEDLDNSTEEGIPQLAKDIIKQMYEERGAV